MARRDWNCVADVRRNGIFRKSESCNNINALNTLPMLNMRKTLKPTKIMRRYSNRIQTPTN